jgi:hypothetical protein
MQPYLAMIPPLPKTILVGGFNPSEKYETYEIQWEG